MKVLDFGCGSGDQVAELSRAGHQAIGADIDVSVAKNKYPDCEFVSVGLGHWPFGDGEFDEVRAIEVLEHVDNPAMAIKEMNRVLKKEGRVTVSVPQAKTEKILAHIRPHYLEQIGHQRIFSRGELVEILQQTGFIVTRRYGKGSFMFFLLSILLRSGQPIVSQRGDFAQSKLRQFLLVINQFFDWEITFKTKAKYLPLWLIGWPVEWIFDKIYPKTEVIIATKK